VTSTPISEIASISATLVPITQSMVSTSIST
jgi:hypothetical protein